jgi:hypothetical protein
MHTCSEDTGNNYLQSATKLFRYYKKLGDGAFAQIADGEIHRQTDPDSNSIAVIAKHMAGNMASRWTDFLTTDGEKEWRDRDAEFVDDVPDKDSLIRLWENGWDLVFSALRGLKPKDLGRVVYVRNEGHTVLEAINRQLTHYGYHVGQIVYLAKDTRSGSWKSLSVPKGKSKAFNKEKFSMPRRRKHFT